MTSPKLFSAYFHKFGLILFYKIFEMNYNQKLVKLRILRKLIKLKSTSCEDYLKNKLHAIGDETKPASVLLHSNIRGSRSNCIGSNGGISERIKKSFSSGEDTGDINRMS